MQHWHLKNQQQLLVLLIYVLLKEFLGFGIVLEIGIGAYSTNQFCEELFDKFVDYYKINTDKILNTYKNAANYFLEKN